MEARVCFVTEALDVRVCREVLPQSSPYRASFSVRDAEVIPVSHVLPLDFTNENLGVF